MIGLRCKLFTYKIIVSKNKKYVHFFSGVYGHFMGSNPWSICDRPCVPSMSLLVGGKIKEVAIMNQLSSNLHFMMVCIKIRKIRKSPTIEKKLSLNKKIFSCKS